MVEFWGAGWLCTKFGKLCQKRTKNPKKVSFHAQYRQKSNPTCVRLVPTETGQNEVPKQTTEEVQGANPGLDTF
jgi:hypothetical protein